MSGIIGGAGKSGIIGQTHDGIKYAEIWRLTTPFTDYATITTNIERDDTFGFGKIPDPAGTISPDPGMTHSSGKFTFPSTGVWQVQCSFYWSGNQNLRYIRSQIQYSSDSGSSFSPAADGTIHLYAYTSGTHIGPSTCQKNFAITNTSTQKVQFIVGGEYSGSQLTTAGNTNLQENYMSFIRLGDL